jgi:hypothetical protein
MARKVISDEGPGRIIDIRRINGAAEVYSGQFSGSYSPIQDRAGAGALYMQLAYTPPVDVWWDVNGNIGIVQKIDANYHYSYGMLVLSPVDVDGMSQARQLITQHSTVQTYESRMPRRLFKLAAGTAYTVSLGIEPGGGTWTYYCGPGQLWLEAKAITR